MAELLLLGTGAAFNDGSREPTMLGLRGQDSTVVIDCGANAVRQLQRLQVPPESVERVILTHSHGDHTSGFPLLVEMLWLGGRRGVLPVHGLAPTLAVVRGAFSQWDTSEMDGVLSVEWHEVPPDDGALVARGADFELTAAPGNHNVPVIGLRAHDLRGGGTVAFSADGEPSPGVQRLAAGVDWLVHEATGSLPGHSSAEGAARLAAAAGAQGLILVHLAPNKNDLAAQQRAAAAIFAGPVIVGSDLERYAF